MTAAWSDAVVAACAVLAAGAMASAGGVPALCPRGCSCAWDDLLWYYCGQYIVKVNDAGYVEINCQNTELNCSALPALEVGRDAPLRRLELTQCALPPAAAVACGGRGAAELALQQAPGGVTADNLRGLEIESLFMTFAPDAIRSFPISAIKSVRSLRRVRLLSGSALALAPGAFGDAPALRLLEISMSGVTDLPAGAFRGLPHLTALSLWGNNIRNVSVDAFDGLESLQQLVLNSNPLGALPPGAFAPTPALRRLYLENVALAEIQGGVLQGLQHLEEIKLRSTVSVKLCGGAFSELPSLRSLSVTSTVVGALPADLVLRSPRLQNLTLSRAGLRRLPEQVFSELSLLRRLDLSGNMLAAVTRRTFRNLTSLEEIDLSGNTIRDLPDKLFSGLSRLKSVRVSRCQLHSVSWFAFVGASAIERLSLSHNKLAWAAPDTELSSPFHVLHNLQELDLSYNNISCVFSDWRLVLRLRTLDLSHNNLTYLSQSDVQFLVGTVENTPTAVDFRHNRITSVQPDQPSSLVSILLDSNPFVCDCHLHSFLSDLQQSNQTKYRVSSASCAQPDSLKGRPLLTLDLEQLTCPVPDYDSKECSCLVRSAFNRVECDCAALAALPELEYSGLDNMTVRLRSVPDRISLPEYVRELNFSGLGLETVPNVPSTVQLLDLTRNRIQFVPEHLLSSNITLRLAQNPIACECSTEEQVRLLQMHLQRSPMSDYERVMCEDGRMLSLLDAGGLCSVYRSALAGALLAGALIVLAALGALIYKYRIEVQVFLYRRGWCLRLLPTEDVENDKLFDVFVSFAYEDEKFVAEQVLPRLSGRYTMQVQHRDWEVGGTIPAQIRRSVGASRRTLVVVSESFLRSMWSREVLRTAHAHAAADHRARALLLLVGVSKKELDEDVTSLLPLSTVVKHGERMWWDKVAFALPRGEAAGSLPPPATGWKGSGLHVVINEEGKLYNAGYVKE